jgi:integrase/recombinase XerD
MSYSRLEPYDGKLSRTVLRGASSLVTDLWAGNGPRLLDSFLFPGSDVSKQMGTRWVQHIITNSARKAGITKRVSPHTLRHSFATHLLEDGVNVRVIQFLLGHKSLKTTATYMHIAKNYVNQAKSPLDSLYEVKEVPDNG